MLHPLRWKLHWQILAALLLAFVLGIAPRVLTGFGVTDLADTGAYRVLAATCDFMGTLFLRALKMIVVPLVASSIICGIAGIGSEKNFTRLGLKTLGYYLLSGLLAVVVGLVVVNVISPGRVAPGVARHIVGQAPPPDTFVDKVEGRGHGDLLNVFIELIPTNVFDAAANNGQLLGLIFFSLLFGFFINRLPARLLEFQLNLWESIQQVMMQITDVIIRFAPLGVFGLVLPIFLRTGFDAFRPLFWFFITVLAALAIHKFITLALLLRFIGGVNPWRHWRSMAPVLLTAFSTASSASTLPVTLDTVEDEAGVSNRTASFTLPLGATVNMDGTALYECIVVIFIGQLYGVTEGFAMPLADQFMVVLFALLTSIGVAGIPSASLVAITLILQNVGLPLEAVGLVLAVDRILDMLRTAVNVYSDTCGAVIIGRSEGETAIYAD